MSHDLNAEMGGRLAFKGGTKRYQLKPVCNGESYPKL
jgi:hypothetical protein